MWGVPSAISLTGAVRTRSKGDVRDMKTSWMRIGMVTVVVGVAVAAFIMLSPAWGGKAMAAATEAAGASAGWPWWAWVTLLFVFCFVLGILAVLGGVGGGVLFTPLVSGFFPFHLDYVRAAGLLVALAGALAAGPGLLKRNLASLRLAMPVALIASICAALGAMVGLKIPTNITQTAMGIVILFIAVLLLVSKNATRPVVTKQDAIGMALGVHGAYYDAANKEVVEWKTHRTLPGLLFFILIGFMAGMFGMGAGWANVPVLNLLMGVPLKAAVGTSKFLLAITDTSAAWIYLNKGCVIPLIAVPSIVGLMGGSFVGVKLLAKAKPKMIRVIVIVILALAGFQALKKGLGW